MKKILEVIAIICLSIIIVLSLAGCDEGQSRQDAYYSIENNKADVTVLAKGVPKYSYFYVVDNKTGVVYIQFHGNYQGGITVMVNPDGTPVLADQIKREDSK